MDVPNQNLAPRVLARDAVHVGLLQARAVVSLLALGLAQAGQTASAQAIHLRIVEVRGEEVSQAPEDQLVQDLKVDVLVLEVLDGRWRLHDDTLTLSLSLSLAPVARCSLKSETSQTPVLAEKARIRPSQHSQILRLKISIEEGSPPERRPSARPNALPLPATLSRARDDDDDDDDHPLAPTNQSRSLCPPTNKSYKSTSTLQHGRRGRWVGLTLAALAAGLLDRLGELLPSIVAPETDPAREESLLAVDDPSNGFDPLEAQITRLSNGLGAVEAEGVPAGQELAVNGDGTPALDADVDLFERQRRGGKDKKCQQTRSPGHRGEGRPETSRNRREPKVHALRRTSQKNRIQTNQCPVKGISSERW